MYECNNPPAAANRRNELEPMFLANLPLLTRILESSARRQRLPADHVEEFTAWAIARFVVDDYSILAKFRGESALSTYLSKVVEYLLREYRQVLHGRWRPSACAGRLGRIGVDVERCVVRDGLPLRQAAELMRTSGVTTLCDRELARIAGQLPRRRCLRPVEYSTDVVSRSSAPAGDWDTSAGDDDAAEQLQRLKVALASLAGDELELLRLVFWKGLSIAEVSRLLGLEQKPMYRRMDRILTSLRRQVEDRELPGRPAARATAQ